MDMGMSAVQDNPLYRWLGFIVGIVNKNGSI